MANKPHIHFGIISLFPEMFNSLEYGVCGRALKQGLVDLSYWNPRDYSDNPYRQVDDRPYGGGPGMVMMAEPLMGAIDAAKHQLGSAAKTILLSPQGKTVTQQAIIPMSQQSAIIFVAGRYEGIDERLVDLRIDEEWSIGDFVLSGGELAAMTMIDAIIRWVPGVLGHEASAQQDSFSDTLLDCPHYTRPPIVAGLSVPDLLLSGDHAKIARWRLKQSLGRTWLRRPDLLANRGLSDQEQALLDEFKIESGVDCV